MLRFAIPVLFALFLQSLYGAVDLLVVGKFADAADVSAVSIGSQIAVTMFYLSFFHGDLLSHIFARDPDIITASAQYLKAYAIDCLLTCFLFCFIGFFNGMELTTFVMAQGIIGAFCVRVPVSFLMSRIRPVSLFRVGLATPCSTIVQILLCFGCMVYVKRESIDE